MTLLANRRQTVMSLYFITLGFVSSLRTNVVYTISPLSGGGLHLYFSYDPALVVRNSSGKLAAEIDVRGENGYVVAPPSTHASGNRYWWDLCNPR